MSNNQAVGTPVTGQQGISPTVPNGGTGIPTTGSIDKVGHTFRNYIQPADSFGEVLTADDMRFTELFGINLVASNGQIIDDNQLRFWVETAVEEVERILNISIVKKRIATNIERTNKVFGTDFDEEDDAYDFRIQMWRYEGPLPLRFKPVLSVERAKLFDITDKEILDLKGSQWLRPIKRPGQLWFFPRQASSGLGFAIGGSGIALSAYRFRDYPGAFEFDYTVGYENSIRIPKDLRKIIGRIATVAALNIIGDGLLAGFSSSSINLDGISESFSSTQGVENAFFGARINQYLKEIETWLKRNRRKFANLPISFV